MADNNKANMTVPDMKLELVQVPVSDVDRAKAFYEKAGFTLEVDTRPMPEDTPFVNDFLTGDYRK